MSFLGKKTKTNKQKKDQAKIGKFSGLLMVLSILKR